MFDLAYYWQTGTPPSHVETVARNTGDQLQRYVFMSSIAAYGPGLDHREGDPLVRDDDPNLYAQHNASAERALFRMHDTSGFPVVTFRPPYVHGPRQPFYREQYFWDRLRDGRPIRTSTRRSASSGRRTRSPRTTAIFPVSCPR